ncbi:type II toxin-antitoxin system HipA family toxin [Desulfurobacterium atlanticum]|uniref:Serine/threonine-protein kinase HipA n=1 Tax=Desulfurobacterium atlanticum TaxID=240169 RepID=A0A238YT85_9BACT|nr:type II toxin-antitoxin system HipA family toxin [Desulfurobacterium atlanticum]SNR73874.1 serine/threonine-protein kinase HipA [Desulfurobacterium atlanticum]
MIKVYANRQLSGTLHFTEEQYRYIFNYLENNPISITMPFSYESYVSTFYLHPIFDMNMPEGYLFEMLTNLLRKEFGRVNDFIIFKTLSPSLEGWLTYESEDNYIRERLHIEFSLEEVIEDNNPDLFKKLIDAFLFKSAISGVQPKVLATLRDKTSFTEKDFIVKTFGAEFPDLAENEYFCMKAVRYAGIPTPKFWLSKNRRFFITERFDFDKATGDFKGFEEFCVLFKKHRISKYDGSYEKIAKAIAKISSKVEEDLKIYFKMIVMNFLLKNGDAHLKNFGILYKDFRNITLAPAYDVINTAIYLPKDKPALSIEGRKVWYSKKELIRFGQEYCLLTNREANELFEECENAILKTIKKIKEYIQEAPSFAEIGSKMVAVLQFSLDKNLKETYKEIPKEVFTWNTGK